MYEKMKTKILDEVKHTFRPEFLNRVDEVVVFHQLTRAEIEEIVSLELNKVIREVKAQEPENSSVFVLDRLRALTPYAPCRSRYRPVSTAIDKGAS